jgi:hypothetical protein
MSKNTHVIAFEKKGVMVEKKINDFQYDFYCKVYTEMPETFSKYHYATAVSSFVIERLKQLDNFHENDVNIHVCSLLEMDSKLFKKMGLKNKEFMELMEYIVILIMSKTVETDLYLNNDVFKRNSSILHRFA